MEEPAYGACSFAGEWWNTVSNALFIAIGVTRLVVDGVDNDRLWWLYVLYPLAGAGSAIQHSCAHIPGNRWSIVIDWLLPGVAPTGKPIAIAFCVVVGFKDGKISHEHVYWDQAGVLVQVGLLDPAGLPVSGGESARKVLDPKLPARGYNH